MIARAARNHTKGDHHEEGAEGPHSDQVGRHRHESHPEPAQVATGWRAPVGLAKPARAPKVKKAAKKKPPRRLADPELTDRQYLAHLHEYEACVGQREFVGHRCRGGGQASHFRNHTGMARKESDRLGIRMCADLHLQQWEAYSGEFKGWTQEDRKGWFLERLRETHRRFVQLHPERSADFYPAVTL